MAREKYIATIAWYCMAIYMQSPFTRGPLPKAPTTAKEADKLAAKGYTLHDDYGQPLSWGFYKKQVLRLGK